jgi:hypothetical protein
MHELLSGSKVRVLLCFGQSRKCLGGHIHWNEKRIVDLEVP